MKRQGYAFIPTLLLEGINLHLTSYRTLFGKGSVNKRGPEIALVTTRFAVYFGIVFWFFPLGLAFAFIGVQLAIFGFYLGLPSPRITAACRSSPQAPGSTSSASKSLLPATSEVVA